VRVHHVAPAGDAEELPCPAGVRFVERQDIDAGEHPREVRLTRPAPPHLGERGGPGPDRKPLPLGHLEPRSESSFPLLDGDERARVQEERHQAPVTDVLRGKPSASRANVCGNPPAPLGAAPGKPPGAATRLLSAAGLSPSCRGRPCLATWQPAPRRR
jgi:hypothetical protein